MKQFGDIFEQLFAPYSDATFTDIGGVVGGNDSKLTNKMLVIINDNTRSTTKTEEMFKSIVSSASVKRMNRRNVSNFILTSNNATLISINANDNKFLCIQCSNLLVDNKEFFDALEKCKTKQFYSALLTFLLQRDTTNFDPKVIPMTEAKKEMTQNSLDDVDRWVA